MGTISHSDYLMSKKWILPKSLTLHRCLYIFCLPIPKDDSGKIHETSEQKTVTTSNENSETDSIFYM